MALTDAQLDDLYESLRDLRPQAQLNALSEADLTSEQFSELDTFASSARVGSGHEEDPHVYPGKCLICGEIDDPDFPDTVDYFYHPLAAGTFLAFRSEEG